MRKGKLTPNTDATEKIPPQLRKVILHNRSDYSTIVGAKIATCILRKGEKNQKLKNIAMAKRLNETRTLH